MDVSSTQPVFFYQTQMSSSSIMNSMKHVKFYAYQVYL